MIPKPDTLRPSTYSIRKLRGDYDWTCQQFRALRDFYRVQAVIGDADERYLDTNEKICDQSPLQWKRFKHKVVAEFPEIEEFEDHWPLLVILSASRRAKKQNERMKKRGTYKPRKRRGRKSRAAVAIQRLMYVGKPLPRRTVNRTVTLAPVSSNDNANDNVISGRVENSGTMTESSSEITMTLSTSRLAPRYYDAQTTTREESLDSRDGAVANRCPNLIPAVSHVGNNNARIITVCQNAQLLIDALALLGISNDKHLFLLNKLAKRHAGVVEFFDSIPNNKLPYLYKMTVLNNLKNEQFNALNNESSSSRCRFENRQSSDGNLPLLLQNLLNRFDMEELIPLFRAAHVTTDEEYMMLRGLDATQRLDIFNQEEFAHVRPFQRWILNFVLTYMR